MYLSSCSCISFKVESSLVFKVFLSAPTPNPLSPALSMSTHLKSSVLTMHNYPQMEVRWSLICPCQSCWQARHEWPPVTALKSSVSVSSLRGDPWRRSSHSTFLCCFLFSSLKKRNGWHWPNSDSSPWARPRLQRRIAEAEASGSVSSPCTPSVVLGAEQLLQQSGSPSCACRTVMSVLRRQAVTRWKKNTKEKHKDGFYTLIWAVCKPKMTKPVHGIKVACKTF